MRSKSITVGSYVPQFNPENNRKSNIVIGSKKLGNEDYQSISKIAQIGL